MTHVQWQDPSFARQAWVKPNAEWFRVVGVNVFGVETTLGSTCIIRWDAGKS